VQLETLKLFCDLAELGSFSKTAEKNLLSQSAVSQQLAQLEKIFKCELLDRRQRPAELTKAGELLYKAAKEILDRYEQLKIDLNNLKYSSQTRVNVAAIFSIGMHTLAEYIKRFMVQLPKVHLHLEYLSAAEIYKLVLSGEMDVGVVAVPRRDYRLDVLEFVNEPLVLACSPEHPLAAEKEVDIHRLQFEPLVAFATGVPTRDWIDGILRRYNVAVHVVLEFDNIETIKRAVEINSGVSILPETAVVQEVKAGTIRTVQFSNERFVRPTGVIIRQGRYLSEAARQLVETLCPNGERKTS